MWLVTMWTEFRKTNKELCNILGIATMKRLALSSKREKGSNWLKNLFGKGHGKCHLTWVIRIQLPAGLMTGRELEE